MKRKVVVGLLATAMLFAVLFGVKGITKVSAATDTELKIAGKNVSYGDSLYILFAVSSSNPEAEVKLLTWTEGTGVYDYGTQEKILTRDAKMKVGGQDCDVFYYPVAAKQMADTVYARAYAEVGGEAVYSEPAKMSVLEYAYNKLGYIGTKTTDAKLETLLKPMLTYGGNSQDYFTYNMDNQATADQTFYKVEVEGGLLSDGFTYGLFKEGQEVAITAPEKDENGYQFNDWKDESGNIVGNTNVLEYEVTANKKLIAEYSQLAFTWQYDNEDHWKHYSLLDADSKHEPHGLKVFSDEVGHWTNCNICGYSSKKEEHNYVTKYDAESHWEECEFCGNKQNVVSHGLVVNHDENVHWNECECGYASEKEAHTPSDKCSICGYKAIKVGDVITFGPYDWQVLAQNGSKFLLITKEAIACKKYNETDKSVTWETCTLRSWLNSSFLGEFSTTDQAKIQTTTVKNLQNPEYGTEGGNTTYDKVFLLSLDETRTYFDNDEARYCYPNATAKSQGVLINTIGDCCWWLRSPGYKSNYAAQVSFYGQVSLNSGRVVNFECNGVRPAMWVNLGS